MIELKISPHSHNETLVTFFTFGFSLGLLLKGLTNATPVTLCVSDEFAKTVIVKDDVVATDGAELLTICLAEGGHHLQLQVVHKVHGLLKNSI